MSAHTKGEVLAVTVEGEPEFNPVVRTDAWRAWYAEGMACGLGEEKSTQYADMQICSPRCNTPAEANAFPGGRWK